MYTARNGTEAVVRNKDGLIIGPEHELEWKEYQEWLDEGNTPSPAPSEVRLVPTDVPMWAARAICKKRGLFDAIDAYIEHMQDEYPEMWEAWNMGNRLSRSSMFLNSLAPVFGLKNEDVDDLMIEANALEA